ncbi:peptidoglycan editing factor PgeF [Brachybacterium huguangmaarense]|uniref:Purine nucleoside phosphorylase n=1 Tax=Brachybacterium huguangmaarense TaxID=1652028 RepID=A0ABY6FYV6_9MICO|nr:peptidoglycan editing factor PgeF [Brachybacterium huguangmaarense]UYG15571.1 peptidoglycan editing factor PgeF [Brachybacterium huguangmaarense]
MSGTDLPARASRLRGARALFTTRDGGVSGAPYASLNLARHVGDDEGAVAANRERLRAAIGVDVVYVDQVHSADVAVVGEGDEPDGGSVRTADALVTRRGDIALAIMVADCLPVLLVDAEAGVVGAAHAGRAGLLGGVLENTVAAMQALGADVERVRAEIGPSVCGSCYEVPAAMRADAERTLPGIGATTRRGTPSLDLRAGAVLALTGAGLRAGHVLSDAPCTVEDERFYSYRREQRTGRLAGVIRRA